MYAIKTVNKLDKKNKIFFEETMEEAEELATSLRKAFSVEIVEIENIKKPMVFLIKEEYWSYNFPEENFTDTIGIFSHKPSDEVMAYFASRQLQEEEEMGRKATLVKDEVGDYVLTTEEGEYTYSFTQSNEIAFA